MSDDQVQVRLGADASQLIAQIELARANLKNLESQTRKTASSMVDAGQQADQAMRAKLGSLGTAARDAKAKIAELEAEFTKFDEGAGKGGHGGNARMQMMESIHVAKSLVDQLVAGQDPMRALAVEGGRIGQILSMGITPAIATWAALGGAVLAVVGALGYAAYQAIQFGNAAEVIRTQAIVDQFELTSKAAGDVAGAISKAANVSYADAEKIAAPFNELGPGGEKIAQIASFYLPMLSKAMGTDAVKAGEFLSKKFKDLKGEGENFVAETVGKSASTRRLYDDFVAAGDKAHAWQIILQALEMRLEQGRTAFANEKAAILDFAGAVEVATSEGAIFGVEQQLLERQAERTKDALEKQTKAIKTLGSEAESESVHSKVLAQQRAVDAEKTAEKIDANVTKIRELQHEHDKLAEAVGKIDKSTRAGTEEAQKYWRAMKTLEDQIAELDERANDSRLGRDSFARAIDQIKELESSFKGSRAALLEQELLILGLNKKGNNVRSGSPEALRYDQEIASKRKELAAAGYSDFAHAEQMKVVAAGETAAARLTKAREEEAESGRIFGHGSEEQKRAAEQLATTKFQVEQESLDRRRKVIEDQIAKQQSITRDLVSSEADAVKRRVISQQEASAQIIARMEAERSAVQKLYEEEVALADKTGLKKQEALDRLDRYNSQVALQMQIEHQRAAEATQRFWDNSAHEILGVFNGQLRGLIEGTTSLTQAGKNIVEDFAIKSIEAGESILANFLVQQFAMNQAATAGAALRLAADQTAASGGIASLVAAAVKAITVDAAQTFAGVTAFLAPVLGPAAFGPAAAAEATVLGSIASADIGMYDVPQDQLAMIHKNELIMPAAEASAFRSMLDSAADGGAGGANVSISPSVQITTSALDGASVAQFWRDNQHGLMRAISEAVRSGAHLGLRRILT